MKKQKLLVAFIEHLDKVGALGYDHCFNFEESAAEFLRLRKEEKSNNANKIVGGLSQIIKMCKIELMYLDAGYRIKGFQTPFISAEVFSVSELVSRIVIKDGLFHVLTHKEPLINRVVPEHVTGEQMDDYLIEALESIKANFG